MNQTRANQIRGKSLETQLDRLCEQVNAMGYHAHKNHPKRLGNGTRVQGEPFDYEILLPNWHACFDAKECHDTKWHMQKKDIIQAENLKHCKNAGCEAFFLIYFFPTKQLVKVDVDEVINVLQQGSKTVGAEKGGEFNIGLIIDKAANELH